MQYARLSLFLPPKVFKLTAMPILQRKINHRIDTLCSHIEYPAFVLPRHRHAEFEIMLFTRGSGKQFVGDAAADYHEGDIALIGSNVPHLHLCNAKLYPAETHEQSAGEALQFHPGIFPPQMEELPDYRHVCDILQRSRYGLRLYDRTLYAELLDDVKRMDCLAATERIVCLLEILEKMHRCKSTELLSPTAYDSSATIGEAGEPVNKVYNYLYNHFKENVSLDDIAEYAGLNPSALCRHFKKRTDKSIFRCLAEIRLGHACKLLSYSKQTIAQVAYASGYNSVTFFIKQFEGNIKCTPSEYRERINNGE